MKKTTLILYFIIINFYKVGIIKAFNLPNDTLNIYFDYLPTDMDGRKTLSYSQWTLIYNLSDRLVEISNNGVLKPNLVESYKVVKNAEEFVFNLNQNRKFHDGSPVTTADVLYSLNLALNNKYSVSGIKSIINCNGDAAFCKKSIKINSNEQFTITLNSKVYDFIERLNMNELAIRKKNSDKSPIYSGAYKISQNNSNTIELEANVSHPNIDKSSYSKIMIKSLQDLPSETLDDEILKILNNKNSVVISKNLSSILLGKKGKLFEPYSFQYGSVNSYLLYLHPSVSNSKQIHSIFQNCLTSIIKDNKFISVTNSFYPKGYSLFQEYSVDKKTVIKTPISLNIKIQKNYLSQEILDQLKFELSKHLLNVSFIQLDQNEFSKNINGVDFQGVIAAPYVDLQDPARLAISYFSGKWNYYPNTPPDIQKQFNQLPTENEETKRNKLSKIYKYIFNEQGLVSNLFNMPTTIFLSNNIDRSNLEFYGNTIKFYQFVRKGD